MSSCQRLPIYSCVGVHLGAPHLSLGPDALHTAQPDAAGWGLERAGRRRAEERTSSTVIRMLLTRGAGGCTRHLPTCQGVKEPGSGSSGTHSARIGSYTCLVSKSSEICHFCSLLPSQGLIFVSPGHESPYRGQKGAPVWSRGL